MVKEYFMGSNATMINKTMRFILLENSMGAIVEIDWCILRFSAAIAGDHSHDDFAQYLKMISYLQVTLSCPHFHPNLLHRPCDVFGSAILPSKFDTQIAVDAAF